MKTDSIITIIFLGIIFGWKFYDYFIELYRNQNMFKKIGWIADKNNPSICYSEFVRLRDYDLLYYIMNEQINLKLSGEFCIDFSNEAERINAEKILDLHKVNVVKSFFSGFITKSKNICKLDSLEYYFYSLYCFIYKELEEYRHYKDKIYFGREYTDNTHFKCKLTDYGRTYYKLYLITNMFVENNEKTKKLFKYINPSLKEHVMTCLKNNEVNFWNYRNSKQE